MKGRVMVIHESISTSLSRFLLGSLVVVFCSGCPQRNDEVAIGAGGYETSDGEGDLDLGVNGTPAKCVNVGAFGECSDCTPGSCGPSGTCHPELGSCVQCVDDQHCTAGFCHPDVFVCVSCWNSSHCDEGTCGEDNVCVGCTQDSDCAVGVCNTTLESCVGGCTSDSDCADDNPCTTDRCDDDNECAYITGPDGAACNDGDPCTGDGFCLTGTCVAGRQLCCAEVEPCGPFAVVADTDGDGCAETCVCEDGTSINALGVCEAICNAEGVNCPAGSQVADTDDDGCADDCVCVDDTCVSCNTDQACDDLDPCTQDLCVNKICVSVPVPNCGSCQTSCDCLDIGQPDDFAPDCPLACATCGNWWGCVDGMCKVTCGAQPAGVAACECEPVDCVEGVPVDSTGDGCADACQCSDGALTKSGESCSKGSNASCSTGCDCVGAELLSSDACAEQCSGCKAQWACVAGVCQEACGFLALESSACGGAELCEATGGTFDPTACGDYFCGVPSDCLAVIGGCDCGQGANFDAVNGCSASAMCDLAGPTCPPIGCDSALGGIDKDGDGCDDVCVCSSTSACAEEHLCLRPPGKCAELGTCVPKPNNCSDADTKAVCGCNDKLYASACEANSAGQSVATTGAPDCSAAP